MVPFLWSGGSVNMINLDIVPSTVRSAAELLAESLSENEREYFRIIPRKLFAETLPAQFARAGRCGDRHAATA